MNKDTQFYLDELKSEQCFCGLTKKRGFSFCYNDYTRLPRQMQTDLWQPMGDGYEEAYDKAVEWLI